MKPAERKVYCKDIQLIFQDPYASLNPRMRIGDIIAEPILTNNILPKDKVEDRVNELLECVGLANYMRNRYPHEFSGGQRQRVGIARALAVNPKLIVCDEPVSALDVSIQAQVLNLLDELKEQFGLTYLFIAHGLNVVKHVSDRVGVMYLGKMMEIAPKKSLYADPLSPYTQALLSAIPSVDPATKRDRIILEGDVPSPIDPPPGCRFAGRCFAKVEGCDEVMPPLVEVKPNHQCACHRYDEGGPGTAVIDVVNSPIVGGPSGALVLICVQMFHVKHLYAAVPRSSDEALRASIVGGSFDCGLRPPLWMACGTNECFT